MTPEDYAKNYFCGGNEPATPYEKGIVEAVAGLIRQAVLSNVSNFIGEAVEQEREACAKVADCIGEDAGDAIAVGIRARSES